MTTQGYVRLEGDDPSFSFNSGIVRCNRAAIEIDAACPEMIRDAIMLAISNDWLRPVAYMPQKEYAWTRLEGGDAQ